jgi:hypothetical protein
MSARKAHLSLLAGGAFTTPSALQALGQLSACRAYTSINRRKRVDSLSDNEIAKAVEWSKAQDETFHLNLPDRTPGEPPALPDQIATIHGLVRSISGSELANLGSKQASFLIDEITKEKAQFTEKKVHEYLDQRQRGSGAGCLLLIVAIAAIGYILFKANH